MFFILQITACNNGGTVETVPDDTLIESADGSADQPEASSGTDPETTYPDTTNPEHTNASLSWAAPSERENNKPMSLSEIAGYKIYYGTSQGIYSDHIVINHGSTDKHTFNNLATGTYYFAITTFDTAGRESQYSAEIILDV